MDASPEDIEVKFMEVYRDASDDGRTFQIPDHLLETIETTSSTVCKTNGEKCIGCYRDLKERRFKYESLKDCCVYNRYYLPIHFLKIHLSFLGLLKEKIIDAPWFERKTDLSVLDVGSGPGTMALALLDLCYFLKNTFDWKIPPLRLSVIERNKDFISIFQENIKNLDPTRFTRIDGREIPLPGKQISFSIDDISEDLSEKSFPRQKQDLVFWGHILKELIPVQKEKLEHQQKVSLSTLKAGGIVLFLETEEPVSRLIYATLLGLNPPPRFRECRLENACPKPRCGVGCKTERPYTCNYGPVIKSIMSKRYKIQYCVAAFQDGEK